LFNRSIAENLLVGNPDATEADIHQAIERAEAIDFIEHHEGGLNAIVGEPGRAPVRPAESASGSRSRSLLKDPPILILDEATSALDAVIEAKVNAALNEVMKGRTTFVIAHRLATVHNVTRILVFDQGRIVESGTFDELVREGGVFATLTKAQFIAGEPAQTGATTGDQ
jgi:ATP-binding cassette, subfamily B, beta-glucan exporter